jgi:hypothetical protein
MPSLTAVIVVVPALKRGDVASTASTVRDARVARAPCDDATREDKPPLRSLTEAVSATA